MSKAPDSTKPPKLVVIGNGMAARRVLEKFFELSPHRYQVTVFGSEPRVYYSRVILSPVLAGEKSSSRRHHSRRRLVLAQRRNVAQGRDDCRDRSRRQDRDECWEPYRTLRQANNANGSTPIAIPVHGVNLPSVVTFRELDDVDASASPKSRVLHGTDDRHRKCDRANCERPVSRAAKTRDVSVYTLGVRDDIIPSDQRQSG